MGVWKGETPDVKVYWAGLGGLRVRWTSENDSDDVHPFLRAAQHSNNRAPRGSPRLHV